MEPQPSSSDKSQSMETYPDPRIKLDQHRGRKNRATSPTFLDGTGGGGTGGTGPRTQKEQDAWTSQGNLSNPR
jgi:hypothetical protein